METAAKRAWQVRAAALVIFVLGFAAGALALNLYQTARPNAQSEERRGFSQVLDQLNLDDDQRDKVKAIFDDARAQTAEVRKECGPKFREIRDRTDARLRDVLTPEQWEQFKSLTASAREHHRHGHDDHDGDR
jgi:Spy/CpxP family protein refolding chaperone